MRNKSKSSLIALFCLQPLLFLAPKDAGQGAIAEMSFLAGSWQGEAMGGEFHAYYSTPEGGKVLSYSELKHGDEVVFHEFEKFEEREDALVFCPFPGGKPAVELEMTEIDEAEKKVVFENPDKDFPTMMVYQRVADDRLVITLSDPHGESEKVEVFDLKRLQ
ncbi:MAG: DUF6265 family protein [Planctomycetota bacterium]|jgi:hypothetical protein